MKLRSYIFSSCSYNQCNMCFICTFFITVILSHFHTIQAGSFYQREFQNGFQDYGDYRERFDFSPIQPLPVREILTNHRLTPSRSSKNKFTPGSKVDVLFVDLNDIEKKPSSSSRGRIVSNSIQTPAYSNSITRSYNGRSSKYFHEPAQSQSRNLHENTRKKIKVERIQSLPAEITLDEILKIIPQVEAQFAKFDKEERQTFSELSDKNSENYSENNRVSRNNKNSRSISRQSRRNNSNSNTGNKSYREVTYYY